MHQGGLKEILTLHSFRNLLHWMQLIQRYPKTRCSIFSYTIFHHLTHAIVNTCPISVPPGCAVYATMRDCATQRHIYKWIFHLCKPLCVLENGVVSECYTGANKLRFTLTHGIHLPVDLQKSVHWYHSSRSHLEWCRFLCQASHLLS